MTNHDTPDLPAPVTPRAYRGPTTPSGLPVLGVNQLAGIPTPTLAFTFGMLCAADSHLREPGRLSTLAEELDRRDELRAVLAPLEPGLLTSILTAVKLDRGARWRRFGQRSPMAANEQ